MARRKKSDAPQPPTAPQAFVPDAQGFIAFGDMRIGLIPVDRFKIARQNFKKLTDVQTKALRESMDKFGFKSFVIATTGDEGDELILLDGHHRRDEAIKVGIKVLPTILLDDLSEVDRLIARFSFNPVVDPQTVLAKPFHDYLEELAAKVGTEHTATYAALDPGFLDELMGASQRNLAASMAGSGTSSGGGSSRGSDGTGTSTSTSTSTSSRGGPEGEPAELHGGAHNTMPLHVTLPPVARELLGTIRLDGIAKGTDEDIIVAALQDLVDSHANGA